MGILKLTIQRRWPGCLSHVPETDEGVAGFRAYRVVYWTFTKEAKHKYRSNDAAGRHRADTQHDLRKAAGSELRLVQGKCLAQEIGRPKDTQPRAPTNPREATSGMGDAVERQLRCGKTKESHAAVTGT